MITEADLHEAYQHLAEHAPRRQELSRTQLRPPLQRTPRGWRLLMVGAAAGFTAAAAVLIAVVGASHHAQPATGTGVSTLVCAPVSGSHPDTTQINTTLEIVRQRVLRETAHGSVELRGNEFVISVRAPDRIDAETICGVDAFTVRPLIAPPQKINKASERRSPLGSLPFPLPKTEAQYLALSPSQRHQINAALSYGCASLQDQMEASESGAIGACTQSGEAVLLGPALLDNTVPLTATDTPPNASAGATAWAVTVTLTPTSADQLTRYEQAHHTDTADPTNCGSAGHAACRAYLVANILEGVITFNPPTATGPTPHLTLTGNMSQQAADRLAEEITGPPLPIALAEKGVSTH